MEVRSEDGAAPSQCGVPRKNISQTINGCEQMAVGHHADSRKRDKVRCIHVCNFGDWRPLWWERVAAPYLQTNIQKLDCAPSHPSDPGEEEEFSLDVNDRVIL